MKKIGLATILLILGINQIFAAVRYQCSTSTQMLRNSDTLPTNTAMTYMPNEYSALALDAYRNSKGCDLGSTRAIDTVILSHCADLAWWNSGTIDFDLSDIEVYYSTDNISYTLATVENSLYTADVNTYTKRILIYISMVNARYIKVHYRGETAGNYTFLYRTETDEYAYISASRMGQVRKLSDSNPLTGAMDFNLTNEYTGLALDVGNTSYGVDLGSPVTVRKVILSSRADGSYWQNGEVDFSLDDIEIYYSLDNSSYTLAPVKSRTLKTDQSQNKKSIIIELSSAVNARYIKAHYKGITEGNFTFTYSLKLNDYHFIDVETEGIQTVIKDQDDTIAVNSEKQYYFNVDPKEGKYYLAVDARIEMGSTKYGSAEIAMQLKCNDQIISNDRIKNYKDKSAYEQVNGQWPSLYYVAHNAYRVNYSPNWDECSGSQIGTCPTTAPYYPYTYIVDITDLVSENGSNIITVKNKLRFSILDMHVNNIKIINHTYSLREEDAMEIPSVGTISPKSVFSVNYTWSAVDGQINITTGGETYNVISSFSYPNVVTWNKFQASSIGPWNVALITDTPAYKEFEGEYSSYKVTRKITKFNEYLKVQDVILNKSSSEDLGIAIKHSIPANQADDEIYYGGYRIEKQNLALLGGTVTQYNSVRSAENPGLYVARANTGVGLMWNDDVCRVQGTKIINNNESMINNKMLCLGPGKSYTSEFLIFPTESAYYYEFVNAARRALNVNFAIDNYQFAHGFMSANKDSQAHADFVNWHNPVSIALSTISRIDANGLAYPSTASGYHYGPDLFYSKGQYTRDKVIAERNAFLAAKPDVKILVYYNIFLTSEDDWETKYTSDNFITDSYGDVNLYTSFEYPRMLPVTDDNEVSNTIVTEHWKFLEWITDNDMGLFWDESTRVDNKISYFAWDGYTGVLDSNYNLLAKVSHPALASLKFRLDIVAHFEDENQPIYANFMPCTKSMTDKHFVRFVEGNEVSAGIRTQFFTPLVWGDPAATATEDDIGHVAKTMLKYGSLYTYYATKYTHSNHFINDLYPFSPKELHKGYIIGENKIFTMYNGDFGFGDASALSATVYDKHGVRTTKTVDTVTIGGKTYKSLTLIDGEFALIYRN